MTYPRMAFIAIGIALCIFASNGFVLPEDDQQRDDSMLVNMKARFYNGAGVANFVEVTMDKFETLASASGFSMSRRTLVYTHGYTETFDEESVRLVVGAYLKARTNANIIALDWSRYSSGDYLTSAVPNARKAGSAIATKIKALVDKGLTMPRLHLMGHSLGGHVSGFIGKNLQSRFNLKPSRITALDPAGPSFYPVSASNRLDAGDADIVDTVLTDPKLYGYPTHLGTISFMANPGLRYQPGCPAVGPTHPDAFCSHHRSWRFWAEAVEKPNSFIGFGDGQAVMGDNFDGSKRGEFTLKTASNSPFGLGTGGRP